MAIPQYSAPNAPFVDASGRLTFAANTFLRDLWKRAGGTDAMSNTELEALIKSLDDAVSRADALGALASQLRDSLGALQAGEMGTQPGGADALAADITQQSPCDVFASEVSWQI